MDEVAGWLVQSVRLPQYEQAFRENEVDGDMLLHMVERDMLSDLVESRLHQCRLCSQLTKLTRRATASAATEAADGDERPKQRRRLAQAARAEAPAKEAPVAQAVSARTAPLLAVHSPALGTLIYARPPLADLEVSARPALPCLLIARPSTAYS